MTQFNSMKPRYYLGKGTVPCSPEAKRRAGKLLVSQCRDRMSFVDMKELLDMLGISGEEEE